MEHAWRAACEPGFMGPFRSSTVKLAQAETSRAAAAPQPVARSQPKPVVAAPVVAVVRPVTPRAPLPGPARTSGLAAQLGAVGSDAAARALLQSLGGRLAGRQTWVEKADVAGRTWHRAMAGGFADSTEAGRFCAGLKAAGQSCFVRSGG